MCIRSTIEIQTFAFLPLLQRRYHRLERGRLIEIKQPVKRQSRDLLLDTHWTSEAPTWLLLVLLPLHVFIKGNICFKGVRGLVGIKCFYYSICFLF